MSRPPTTDPLVRLERVVQTKRGELCSVARSEGLDGEEALECVQDALCTWLGRDPSGDEEGPDGDERTLRTVKAMVRNAARNFRRMHRRALPHEPAEGANEPLTADTAEEMLSHAEDVVRLRACVAALCGVQRAVVLLRLLDERSGEDTAEALGITRGHVDVLVHRAKSELRVCMRHSEARAAGPRR